MRQLPVKRLKANMGLRDNMWMSYILITVCFNSVLQMFGSELYNIMELLPTRGGSRWQPQVTALIS